MMVDLPHDLIIELLSKLSVATLLRFRTVCKAWYHIISNPRFCSLQTHQVIEERSESVSWAVPIFVNYSSSAYIIINSYHKSPYILTLSDELKPMFITPPYMVAGPCNGVFLWHDIQGNAVLCNHATREFKKISQGYDFDPELARCNVFDGFGSEELSDGRIDFVVVRLYVKEMEGKRPRLYRSSTGSWKELDPIPEECKYRIIFENFICIDGVFYWLAAGAKPGISFLLTFDMRKETFRKLDFPEDRPIGIFQPKLACYKTRGKSSIAFLDAFLDGNEKTTVYINIRFGNLWVKESFRYTGGEDGWYLNFLGEESLAPVDCK